MLRLITAADFGRRHQSEEVLDVRRALINARSTWYPVMLQLQWFKIAISWVSVNHDGRGGSAPDPLVWDKGSRTEHRKVDIRVNVDLATRPGPPGFLDGPLVQINGGLITGSDVAAWPYSASLLCGFSSFLGFSVHWPVDTGEVGSLWGFLLVGFE